MASVTIKDIAKIAMVSHTTVSRVLNNKAGVSEETRGRILAIMEENDFRPSLLARGLVMRRSKTLGLVITTIRNPFYIELAQGVEDTARLLGYNIIFCSTSSDNALEREYIDMLLSRGVDGIIFSSADVNDLHIQRLVDDGFPLVLVNRKIYDEFLIEKIDYVVMKNVEGGFLAVEHLIRMGHKRIGVISGASVSSAAVERLEGAKKAFDVYGLSRKNMVVFEGDFLKSSGLIAGMRMLALTRPPTAIFAVNDSMAFGAWEAVIESGAKVGDDVAVVGFNNVDCASFRGVDLTTIGQKIYEMGAITVRTLIDRIEGRIPVGAVHVALDPELIIRKSCGFHVRGYVLDRKRR